jgi:hypothetical protein
MSRLLSTLDEQFAALHERSCALVSAVPADKLYWQPRPSAGVFPVYSCGEHILRSGAAVEQTFGGITVNLWDDPFEWTLPEALPTPAHVVEYLSEAEATRRRGFALLHTDEDLSKQIAAPSGEMLTLFRLITDTLLRASHHQGRAFATFRLFSDARLPPV